MHRFRVYLYSGTDAFLERVERRPAEPCPRRQEVDLELGIPRRRLVLQGPLYSSSYAHWYSRVFSPPSPSTGEP
ncbi:hypothetical protein IscW_ISCW001182 [Ixodes scapularis]|uniref:Uncharacterized protein n=1 Tax=Ixodes scapularis TaxID=6945 RepID=B7P3E1_IXOSC|nr:hypothetical protein IscW_ISCW001182 [Ixodes scapularis]|eukprot:XP_002404000.1 hypothetical protein IscW_ISCW001182 [Ixodes scapularis]